MNPLYELPLQYKAVQLEKMVFNFRDTEYSIERLETGLYCIIVSDILLEFAPEYFEGNLNECYDYLKSKLGIVEVKPISITEFGASINQMI